MRTYETLFITLPTLSDEEEKTVVDQLEQVVTDSGGSMAFRERMGRRRLAYTINKFEDGVYTRFLYDSEPDTPKELDRRLRINDKILRHMTVFMEPEWATYSKEQAVRDAQARAEAEAARAAGLTADDSGDEETGRRSDEGDDDADGNDED